MKGYILFLSLFSLLAGFGLKAMEEPIIGKDDTGVLIKNDTLYGTTKNILVKIKQKESSGQETEWSKTLVYPEQLFLNSINNIDSIDISVYGKSASQSEIKINKEQLMSFWSKQTEKTKDSIAVISVEQTLTGALKVKFRLGKKAESLPKFPPKAMLYLHSFDQKKPLDIANSDNKMFLQECFPGLTKRGFSFTDPMKNITLDPTDVPYYILGLSKENMTRNDLEHTASELKEVWTNLKPVIQQPNVNKGIQLIIRVIDAAYKELSPKVQNYKPPALK
jgi:hypothetical protein